MIEDKKRLFFALINSAISENNLEKEDCRTYRDDFLPEYIEVARQHDILHLLIYGLKKNQLLSSENKKYENEVLKAVYRYRKLQYDLERLCEALEKAQIPFIPLKGSVIRQYYVEPWMRTSCDIDLLIHYEDLESAIAYLTDNLQYTVFTRTTHDISLYSPGGTHVELHFELVEEKRANDAIKILGSVWEHVSLCENRKYQYEMGDAYFYFYHIAHMAKHFEEGGCGIRPFIDVWVLNHKVEFDRKQREKILADGNLLTFAEKVEQLSEIWLEQAEHTKITKQMEEYLLEGGCYGTVDNRVAVKKKHAGRVKYLFSRIFVPYSKLVRYYPILEKHKWMFPAIQIRRWFMLFKPDIAKMAKYELKVNSSISKEKVSEVSRLIKDIGL